MQVVSNEFRESQMSPEQRICLLVVVGAIHSRCFSDSSCEARVPTRNRSPGSLRSPRVSAGARQGLWDVLRRAATISHALDDIVVTGHEPCQLPRWYRQTAGDAGEAAPLCGNEIAHRRRRPGNGRPEPSHALREPAPQGFVRRPSLSPSQYGDSFSPPLPQLSSPEIELMNQRARSLIHRRFVLQQCLRIR